MANTIRLKRGTGIPLATSLVTGELAINTTNGYVYTKTDAGNVVQVGSIGGGGSWGSITGDLVDQADLQLALDNKYDASNPNGYIQEANTDGNYYVRRSGLWELLPSYDLSGYALLSGSAFTGDVTTTGRMGIGGGVAINPANKLAIYNGNIVFSQGYGLAFGDGTTQTTAANLAGYAPIESPVLTGDPQGPTAALGDSDTSLANTAFVQQELASGTAVAKAVIATVRNETGATITKGTVVYISGASSNKALIFKAQANAESTSASTYGIVQADIAHNNNGTVVISGIISDLDTSAFTAGVPLYLSPTVAGALTSTKPSAPNHMVSIGVVTYQHANQGAIQLRVVNGFELEELHNVAITTPADKNLLAYESATSLYKNKTAASLGIAELSGATFTGKVNATATATVAGINIGTVTATPTSLVNGDIWIGTALNFRGSDGSNRTVPVLNTSNTFTANTTVNTLITINQTGTVDALSVQTSNATNTAVTATFQQSGLGANVVIRSINTGSNQAALRVEQRGAGHAFVVEDSQNPDTHSFVIDSNGNVGIGVDPATFTATEKLEVKGNIKFNDGTVQTTAANATFVDARAASVVRGTVSVNTSNSYTLGGGGPNQVIKQDTNTASTSVITVPSESTVSIPVGSQFVLIQSNSDPFVVTPESGVGVSVSGNRYKSNGLYSVCTLIKTDANEWYLAGDLTTA